MNYMPSILLCLKTALCLYIKPKPLNWVSRSNGARRKWCTLATISLPQNKGQQQYCGSCTVICVPRLYPDDNRWCLSGDQTGVMQTLRRPLRCHRCVSRRTKLHTYNAAVLTVLLYGAETWPPSRTLTQLLQGFLIIFCNNNKEKNDFKT